MTNMAHQCLVCFALPSISSPPVFNHVLSSQISGVTCSMETPCSCLPLAQSRITY